MIFIVNMHMKEIKSQHIQFKYVGFRILSNFQGNGRKGDSPKINKSFSHLVFLVTFLNTSTCPFSCSPNLYSFPY